MLLEIDGKRYPVKAMEDLELRHVAKLQHELSNNPGITSLTGWGDIRRVLGEWGNLPKREREAHPEGMFLTCLTIWASRVLAGEDLTLMEAISVPARKILWVAEPSDRAAGDGEGKAHAPRSGSGGGNRASRRAKPKAASSPKSMPESSR